MTRFQAFRVEQALRFRDKKDARIKQLETKTARLKQELRDQTKQANELSDKLNQTKEDSHEAMKLAHKTQKRLEDELSRVRNEVKKHLNTIKTLNAKLAATEERNGHVEDQNVAFEIEISELKS